MALQPVHLRINDAATGQPTPVRLRVTDAAGHYYPPFGHFAEFPTGPYEAVGGDAIVNRRPWAYIDGACEIALPAGELTLEATKGPEYAPLHETVTLTPGKMALRFAITRTTNLAAEGWYAADTRCHELSPNAACLEAAAEDLAVAFLLAARRPMLAADGNSYWVVPNREAYSAQAPATTLGRHVVAVGTHNIHPVLGKLALLHTHRVVHPLAFGGPDDTDDWSLDDWCGQAHRKGGLVVWTDAADLRRGLGMEALANAILGHVDAFEVVPNEPVAFDVWALLANAGVRLPLVGASGKASNRVPLGAMRTYARLSAGEAFTLTAWIEAVRAGRTFVTAGPLVRFDVDGTTARASAGADVVEIVHNGKIVAKDSGDVSADNLGGGWVAARVWRGGKLAAHTSAVAVPGEVARDAKAVEVLRRHLDAGRIWVADIGRFDSAKSREHRLGVFDEALAKLIALNPAGGVADT